MPSFPWEKSTNKDLQAEPWYCTVRYVPGLLPSAKRNKGVSLIESLLVVVVVGAIVFLMANLPNAMNLVTKSRHLSLAREIIAKGIEDKRAISYINLVNDTTAISDPRISLLPQGVGQVIVEDCNPQICTNSEKIKQVTVTINWKDNNKEQSISLKTFIGEGGINQ